MQANPNKHVNACLCVWTEPSLFAETRLYQVLSHFAVTVLSVHQPETPCVGPHGSPWA